MPEHQKMEDLPYKVIKPPSWFSFNFSEVLEKRNLIYLFAWRELKIKYKNTLFGVLWVLFQPLFIIAILVAITVKITGKSIANSSAEIFSSYIVWAVFYNTVTHIISIIQSNENVIKKNTLPVMVLPLAGILTALIDTFILIAGSIFVCILMQGIHFLPGEIYKWLIAFLMALPTGIGTALILASLTIRFRDIKHVIAPFLQVLFFMCPIFYTPFKILLYINPMTTYTYLAKSITESVIIPQHALLIASIITLFILLAGIVIFRRTEYFIADIM